MGVAVIYRLKLSKRVPKLMHTAMSGTYCGAPPETPVLLGAKQKSGLKASQILLTTTLKIAFLVNARVS